MWGEFCENECRVTEGRPVILPGKDERPRIRGSS